MLQALLAIWNILQNSNVFNRSQETVLVMPFGNEKMTQFSGFPPTSVSYLEVVTNETKRNRTVLKFVIVKN